MRKKCETKKKKKSNKKEKINESLTNLFNSKYKKDSSFFIQTKSKYIHQLCIVRKRQQIDYHGDYSNKKKSKMVDCHTKI